MSGRTGRSSPSGAVPLFLIVGFMGLSALAVMSGTASNAGCLTAVMLAVAWLLFPTASLMHPFEKPEILAGTRQINSQQKNNLGKTARNSQEQPGTASLFATFRQSRLTAALV